MDKVKRLADELYDRRVKDGWKNVSMENMLNKATEYFRVKQIEEQLTITAVGKQSELLLQAYKTGFAAALNSLEKANEAIEKMTL